MTFATTYGSRAVCFAPLVETFSQPFVRVTRANSSYSSASLLSMNFDLGSSVRSASLRASAARSRQNFGPPIVIGFLGELRPLMQRWPELHVPGRSLSGGGRWRTGFATRSLAPSADDALLEALALSSRRQSSPCLPLALMTRVRRPAEGGTQHRTGAWSQGGEHHHPCAR